MNKLLFFLLVLPTFLFAQLPANVFQLETDNYKARKATYQIWKINYSIQGQDTSYTPALELINQGWHSLYIRGYQADAQDSVDITIAYQVSPYDSASYWALIKAHNIHTQADTFADIYQFYPPTSRYIRFRLIGGVSNDASSGSTIYARYFIWNVE